MELYLFDKPKFQRLYNCTFYNVDQIPLEERTHTFWGSFFLAGYVIFVPLYVICLYAMCVSNLRKSTTYKLMIQLGFTQLIGLQFAGLYTGLLPILGVVYCSAPEFVYISSALTCSHWVVSSTTCDILGINRLCALYSSELANKVFGGKKLCFWMALPLVYGLFMLMYMPPNLYNSQMIAYFTNPHFGYFDDHAHVYVNYLFSFHDTVICSAELLIHIGMPVLYFRALRTGSEELRSKIHYEKQIYFQVIFIGLINFFTSLTYIIIQFFPITFTTTLTATIGYLFSQGMTSIVYLCINRSIQSIILKKLRKAVSGQIGMLPAPYMQQSDMPSTTVNNCTQRVSTESAAIQN